MGLEVEEEEADYGWLMVEEACVVVLIFAFRCLDGLGTAGG